MNNFKSSLGETPSFIATNMPIDNNNKYMEMFLESAIRAQISAIIPPPCIEKKKKQAYKMEWELNYRVNIEVEMSAQP